MSPLQRTATHEDIESLRGAGLVSADAASRAAGILAQPATSSTWTRTGRLALLGLGVIQILSGIIFFFAANWSLLTKWERMGSIFVLVVGCAIVGRLRHDTLVGQLSLTAATALVGAFMAVFGQVYQTGADAWTLFASWAALTVIWVGVSRFWPLIMLWFIILQTAVFTYIDQMLVGSHVDPLIACAFVCLVAIGVASWASWASWSVPRWVFRVMAFNCAAMLVLPVLKTTGGLLMSGVLVATVLGAWAKMIIDDLFLPAVALGIAILAFTRVIVVDLDYDDIIFTGVIITIQVGLATTWLCRQWLRTE